MRRAGSLRQAITNANANAGTDAISFQAGLTGTLYLDCALPNISDDLSIAGAGATVLTVQRRCRRHAPVPDLHNQLWQDRNVYGLTITTDARQLH